MKSIYRTMMAGTAIVLPALMMATTASAAKPFFEGKQVIIFITSGAGGSVDLMNRLGARHLSAHLPGHPAVIAKNKTGAGGVFGANYIYNEAPKDGTQLAGSLMAVPFARLYYGHAGRGRNVKFDPTKFNWIASPAPFVAVAEAWHTSPVKTWKDLKTHQLVVGSSGLGSSSTVDAIFLKNLLGFKYKVILGYPGGGDIDLAMARGETQGRATNAWAGITSRHPDWLRDGKIRILYQEGLAMNPGVPKSVPLLIDQISDPGQKALLRLKMAQYAMGYPVYAPPGVPKGRVATLRKAFWDTYHDPKYLADAKKARVLVAPIKAERLTKIIDDTYAAPESLKKQLRALLKPSAKLTKVKPAKVATAITGLMKKGKVIVFDSNGKETHAKIGRKSKLKIAGKKAKRGDLKVGMTCDIAYFGEMGQVKTINCK